MPIDCSSGFLDCFSAFGRQISKREAVSVPAQSRAVHVAFGD